MILGNQLFYIAAIALSAMPAITAENAQGKVEESPISEISYVPGIFNELLVLSGVNIQDGETYMRDGISNIAMLRWEKKNTEKNWAFTIEFNEPNLDSNEKAGIYLRYTEERPKTGLYKGGSSKFTGMVAGIEFGGKTANLIFTHNEGKEILGMEDFYTNSDSIKPSRLKGVSKLKMKIINTEKNIKIELYDEDRLIYDGFRPVIGKKLPIQGSGGYFGITTAYKEVSTSKIFHLKNAQLYSRLESEDYDPDIRQDTKQKILTREKYEINHPNVDVKDLIHKTEHLLAFIHKIFGDVGSSLIERADEILEKELNTLNDKIKRYININRANENEATKSINVNRLEVKIKQLKRKINELNYSLHENVSKKSQGLSTKKYLMLMVGSGILGVLIYRELQKSMVFRNVKGSQN